MVSFSQPWVLLGLPLAAALAWWSWWKPRPALVSPLVADWRSLPVGRAKRVRWMQSLLVFAAAACWILALANPRRPDLATKVPAEGIGIVLVMDVSGSMATPDFIPREGSAPVSRLEVAKQAIGLFVAGGESADGLRFPGRNGDRIGLVTFASVPATVCPTTFNHSVLLEMLRNQGAAGPANAETNLGDALGEGCLRLEALGPGRRKVLVLLSDGEHNKVGEGVLNPEAASALANTLQIPIYTIDCGGDPSGADQAAIKQRNDGRAVLDAVARQTGGRSFVANNGAELRTAFASIDGIERQTAETPLYREYREFRRIFGGTALAFLMLAGGLTLTRWRRNP
jgi:Ca-activated chloride channel family protein